MQKALEKRPVSSDDIETSLSHIKSQLRATGEREVSAKFVGELVMSELKSWIKSRISALRRFYRSFEDIREFGEEIARLQGLNMMHSDEFYMARALELAALGRFTGAEPEMSAV